MEKISDSQSVSNLRDRRTGLDPGPSGADISTISSIISQLEFDSATSRGIASTKAIQDTSGKGNKQPVRRMKKVHKRRKQNASKMKRQGHV